jgi:hypothetical protein
MAQVSAGGEKPAGFLGLTEVYNYSLIAPFYEDTELDTFLDTFPGIKEEDHAVNLQAQDNIITDNSTLSTRIFDLFTGMSGGQTVAQIRALLAAQDGKPDRINHESITRAMNRMAKRGELAKVGKGRKALYCLPEYEDTVRQSYHPTQKPVKPVQEPQTSKRFRFPKFEDIVMNLDEDDDERPLPLSWPLGLERLVEVYPGNLIVLGGVTNAGKTALLLDFVWRNRDRFPIRYFNTEMKKTELRKRLRLFENHVGVPFESWEERVSFVPWKCKVGNERSVAGLLHYLDPNGINIVDYLTVSKDFTEVADVLDRIDGRLKDGICIVALQKGHGVDLPYGKLFNNFVARLSMNLDPAPRMGKYCTLLTFTKVKAPVDDSNKVEQVKIWFNIKGGAKITLKKTRYLGKPFPY